MVDRARRLGRWFLALDSLLVILGFFVVMPMISLRFVDQLGWAAGVVGLALGLRQLTQQGLGVFGGSLADKFGARPLIVCGMLLRALGFASLAYAQSGLELILSCIISGLGGCLFDLLPRRAQRFQGLTSRLQVDLPGLGQRQAAGGALEQAGAEFRFQVGDGLGQRRGRLAQALGATAEATGFGSGDEHRQGIQFVHRLLPFRHKCCAPRPVLPGRRFG